MNDEYDITDDIARFMSPYVSWQTEPAYVPMTEDEAQAEFMAFLDRIQGHSWNEGYRAGWLDKILGGRNHNNPYTEAP